MAGIVAGKTYGSISPDGTIYAEYETTGLGDVLRYTDLEGVTHEIDYADYLARKYKTLDTGQQVWANTGRDLWANVVAVGAPAEPLRGLEPQAVAVIEEAIGQPIEESLKMTEAEQAVWDAQTAVAIEQGYVTPLGGDVMNGIGEIPGTEQSSGQLAVAGIPAVGGLLSSLGLSLPAGLASLLGIATAGYGIYQALGGGEGEGLFGLDILGGADTTPANTPVPLGGPGLAEPQGANLVKEWHINYPKGRAQYYLVQRMGANGRRSRYIMMYKTWDKTWTWWRLPKPNLAVIGKNMPSHRMLTRLRRNLSKQSADARTILKITSPKSLRQTRYRRRR